MNRLRSSIGRYQPSANTFRATSIFDLDRSFPRLIRTYQAYGISPMYEDGFRPLKLIQNAARGSKLNDNYCFRVPGLNKTKGAIPHMCRSMKRDMLFNNEVLYKLAVGGSSTRQIAQEMGLVSHDKDGTATYVNNAPITSRASNLPFDILVDLLSSKMRNDASYYGVR